MLDINNVQVSAVNQDYCPRVYLNDFPIDKIEEIHLAGHAPDQDDEGRLLLIDAHAQEVSESARQLVEDVARFEWAWQRAFHVNDDLLAASERLYFGV